MACAASMNPRCALRSTAERKLLAVPGSKPPSTRAEAIVFDFDGVLVDSEAVHGRALAAAAELLGLRAPEGRADWYIGLGDVACFERMAHASGRSLTPGDLALLTVRKGEAFASMRARGEVGAFPGAMELLRTAAGALPIAVCSGSHRTDIEPILAASGVLGLLSAMVTADDVLRTKPDPASDLMTAERLGIAPSRCIAIEDSPSGIAAARAAGYRRIHAICHTFSPERLADADVCHTCIAELTLAELVT